MNVRSEFERIIAASYEPQELRRLSVRAEVMASLARRFPRWKGTQGRSL
jgi:hypothetical protein